MAALVVEFPLVMRAEGRSPGDDDRSDKESTFQPGGEMRYDSGMAMARRSLFLAAAAGAAVRSSPARVDDLRRAGDADDTAAIARAIDLGGDVLLTPGRTYVTVG